MIENGSELVNYVGIFRWDVVLYGHLPKKSRGYVYVR